MTVATPRLSHHSLAARLLHLLRQGITPEKLALSIALGVGISCFPVFGTTTLLCTLIALTFRLNLPAIQVGNYLAMPLQLALLVPLLRFGERLFHAAPLPLSPQQILTLAKTSPDQTARLFLHGQWHAIVGWMIVAPFIVLVLNLLLRPLMRLLLARSMTAPAAVTISR